MYWHEDNMRAYHASMALHARVSIRTNSRCCQLFFVYNGRTSFTKISFRFEEPLHEWRTNITFIKAISFRVFGVLLQFFGYRLCKVRANSWPS